MTRRYSKWQSWKLRMLWRFDVWWERVMLVLGVLIMAFVVLALCKAFLWR